MDFDRELKVADIIIDVNCTFWSCEQNGAAVRGPFKQLKLNLEFFSPKARSFNRANYHGAILVDNADLFTVWSPFHVSNYTLVSIVDHFFEPMLFVHHPHNDQALFIRGCQLLVLIVPLNNNHIALVAL